MHFADEEPGCTAARHRRKQVLAESAGNQAKYGAAPDHPAPGRDPGWKTAPH